MVGFCIISCYVTFYVTSTFMNFRKCEISRKLLDVVAYGGVLYH